MRHSSLITKRLLASVIGLSMVSLANAASITYPASSSVFSSGTTTFEYSAVAYVVWDSLFVMNQGYNGGMVAEALDEDGYRTQASFGVTNSSVTLDSANHQILRTSTTGGITHTVHALRNAIAKGATLSIGNLNIDLVNKKIYADLTGTNELGTLTQVHMWDFNSSSTTITREETDGFSDVAVTQTLVGLNLTPLGTDAYIQELNLIGLGAIFVKSIPTFGDFGTLTIVNRFNVDPAYFTAVVPEPSSLALVAVGLLSVGIAAARRRRVRAPATA